MSVQTGVRRIAQVFRGIGVMAVIATAVGVLLEKFASGKFENGLQKGLILEFVALTGFAVLFCALLWGVAWVMEGFVKE